MLPGISAEKISSGVDYSLLLLLLCGHPVCRHIFLCGRKDKCLELKGQHAVDGGSLLGRVVCRIIFLCLIWSLIDLNYRSLSLSY